MARANRVGGGAREGGIFHVTHRCHNRAFLLRFACDRDGYREKLREHVKKYEVWLLDYCVTSNHVHLLLDAEERLELSGCMQEVASEFAREYNRRKGRMNASWVRQFSRDLGGVGAVFVGVPLLHRTEHEPMRSGATPQRMGVGGPPRDHGPAATVSVDRSGSIVLATGDE